MHLVNQTIPATTSVAACMRADTHEGPSIASGSHPCMPNITHLIFMKVRDDVSYHISQRNGKKWIFMVRVRLGL